MSPGMVGGRHRAPGSFRCVGVAAGGPHGVVDVKTQPEAAACASQSCRHGTAEPGISIATTEPKGLNSVTCGACLHQPRSSLESLPRILCDICLFI